jgi:hypothetical protein
MNIQEAYKKLDLAKGLSLERVESQYQKIKAEMEEKISATKNEKLQQVYINRLSEVENAYSSIVEYYESQTSIESDRPEIIAEPENTVIKEVPFTNVQVHKNNRFIKAIIIVGCILLVIPIVYFLASTYLTKKEVDLFRKMDGEVQVFVNNLILRQYPDAKSTEIETFPFGTRLIFDENEAPKTDEKNRTWRKVRVIHPVYGWDKPDERFPYPFEGWMATEQCGIKWMADSLTTAKLGAILGNEDAGRSVISTYRHSLIDYFSNKNYLGDWVIYGSDKNEKTQLVMLNNFGNSYTDCNGDEQSEFVAILENIKTGKKKLLVLSARESGNYDPVYDGDIESDVIGLRRLTRSEQRIFANSNNPIELIYRQHSNQVLYAENGYFFLGYW